MKALHLCFKVLSDYMEKSKNQLPEKWSLSDAKSFIFASFNHIQMVTD